jgi:hypothetical protein
LETGEPRSPTREDEDAIELVLLLFECLLQDNALDDSIRPLIGRLQIPVAKLALRDKGFFSDVAHPARRLINHLIDSALGWVDAGDRGPGSLPSRIELIVRQVAEGDRIDRQRFEGLDAVYTRLIAGETEQARVAEERACEEMRERDEKSSTEAVVRETIAERLRSWGEVPEAVASFANEGWARVMIDAYREGGASSDPWQRSLEVLDRLIWSVQPKRGDDDRRELLRGIPELLRSLREALDLVSYDQRRLASTFRELQALHMAALRRTHGESARDSADQPNAAPTDRDEWSRAPAAPASPSFESDSAQSGAPNERLTVQGLRIGTWLEIRRGQERRRAKLACYGPESGLHLFVDRRGQKILELDGGSLIGLFARGAAIIVGEADGAALDRAFEALIRTLEGG